MYTWMYRGQKKRGKERERERGTELRKRDKRERS
jgi:hypothetical protein